MRRRRWRDAAGQATSEYVALVALVAVVATLSAGLTAGGVGGQVLAGLQRGLCRVAGVRCSPPQHTRDELAPCPVERTTSAESLQGALELMTLGGGASLSAVRMSDGRVQITLTSGETDGGAMGLGYSIGLGRRHGATAAVDVEQHFAPGRSWTLPNAAAAHAFLARYGAKATVGGKAVDLLRSGCSILCDAIGWRPHAELPPADEVSFQRGVSGQLDGTLGSAGLETSSDHTLGVRVERDGGRTLYLSFDGAVGAALLSTAGLGVEREQQAVAAFTLDARERLVELSVETVGSGAAAGMAQPSVGRAWARAEGDVGLVTESTATLDLRDRRNRAAALALRRTLAGGLAPQRLLRSAAAVGRRIARTGVVDRRTYALTRSDAAFGGTLVLGAQLGGGFERSHEHMRLLSAQTRLPGLPFLPRDDCRSA